MDPKVQYVAAPITLIEGIANYLMTRPYREVAPFLASLQTDLKPIPGQEPISAPVIEEEKKAA